MDFETRTFPISGKFSPESRSIYDIVLKMQLDCIDMLKEGVLWEDVHLTAHKIAIDGLLELGILQGDKEEILKSRTSVAFLPHGLGHYLGMDTHDTGGHPNYEDKDTMFRYLRVRGNLPAGSIITVEPGVSGVLRKSKDMLKDYRFISVASSLTHISRTQSTANSSMWMCWTSTGRWEGFGLKVTFLPVLHG